MNPLTPRTEWSDEGAQRALKELKKTKRPSAGQTMSTKKVLFQYYLPVILQWLEEEGWTYQDICTALAQQGLQVKPTTLYSYVYQYRRQMESTAGPATPSAAPSVTPESDSRATPVAAASSHPPDVTPHETPRRRPFPKVDYTQGQTRREEGSQPKKETLVDRLNKPL